MGASLKSTATQERVSSLVTAKAVSNNKIHAAAFLEYIN